MQTFVRYTPKTAKAGASDIFADVIKQMGFLPNVLAAMGDTPPSVTGFVTLNQSFAASSLSPLEREIVQLVASMENHSSYCVAAHTAFANMQDLDMEIIEAVRTGALLADPKLRALQIFTSRIVLSKGHLS